MKKRFLSLVVFSILLLPFILAQEEAPAAIGLPSENDCLYYFYGENCPSCPETDQFIRGLQQRYPNLQLTRYEVFYDYAQDRARTNQELLNDYFTAFGVDEENRGIPAVFLPRSYLVGEAAIRNYLEQQIVENSDMSCPSIGRRAVVGVVAEKSPTTLLETLTVPVVASSAIKDTLKKCSFALLILFLGLLYWSLKKKVLLRGGLFIGGSLFIQFLLGISVFYQLSRSFQIIYGLLALGAVIASLLIIVKFVSDWDVAASLLAPAPMLQKVASGLRQLITSPPGALILGALGTFLLLPCQGANYYLLSSLIVQEPSIAPVGLLLLYIIFFTLPFIIILGALHMGIQKMYASIAQHPGYGDRQRERAREYALRQVQLWLGWIFLLLAVLIWLL